MKLIFVILYDAGILLYRTGIQIASVWNPKAQQWIEGRKNLFQKIESQLKPGEYRVWFHCASVGEFEQGRPVMEAYRKKFPSRKIVLTFYSPSGYELRKNYSGADYIFYLPLDTKRNAEQFISLIDPQLAVFMKYELWFHFLSALTGKKIPAVVISAIFRADHLLFRSISKALREVVKSLNRIFVQDENSLKLLQQHGFSNVEWSGDTRFDRVWQIAQSPKQLPLIEQFKAEKKILVAGSTWPNDEKLLLQLIKESNDSWKWIIVPHEIDSAHIADLKRIFPDAILYSETEAKKFSLTRKVLIVDQVGFLSSIYQYADLAYVGGGFGKGIHNTIEAAVYGIPVLFGPNYQKFNEAKKLIETGGGKSVRDFSELENALEFYQQEKNVQIGKLNRNWIQSETGATEKIMKFLEGITSGNAASRA